jgi:hypothetical protein
MKNILKKYGLYILFAIIGAFSGYLYWYHIGCKSGTCPITSHWYTTSLYGALLGYLSGDLLMGFLKKIRNRHILKDKKE